MNNEGKNRGLTIMVDSHANILSPGTVGDDFEGTNYNI